MKYLVSLVFLAATGMGFVILELADTTPQCDLEWRYYDYTNSCYYQGDYQDFTGAENACKNMGGHLTSIHTNFENSFIQAITESGEKQNTDGMTWIGLQWVNNAWTWTDGTPVNFQWWMKGAPTKESKFGCAILLQDEYSRVKSVKSYWDNTECKYKERKYVCKKSPNY